MNRNIFIIAEPSGIGLPPAMQELAAFAQALADGDADAACILAPGRGMQATALALAEQTGLDVVALENDALESYNAEAWMAALAPWLAGHQPRYICMAHTSRGSDLAPGLAVRLGAACITAVEGIHRQQGATGFVRSVLNGKIRMSTVPRTETTVLTVLPGAFRTQPSLPEKARRTGGHVQCLEIPVQIRRIRTIGLLPAAEQDTGLAEADVIVSAGRGIGAVENLLWIRRLAALFPKSAIGCSRPVCDQGWLDYKHQVGLTGRTVAPKLYIACGISGAAQHIAGMADSRFIVAVNKDAGATIFRVADVGVVEDLNTFLPLLLQKAGGRR